MKCITFCYFIILFSLPAWGQQLAYQGSPDNSFFQAREFAYEGQHQRARDTLHNILSEYPNYTDVRALLGKTYSWDGNYSEARRHFNRITSVERQHKDAWLSAIKNELYADNLGIALGLVNKALRYLPLDMELSATKQHILREIEISFPEPVPQEPVVVTEIEKEEEKKEEPKILRNELGIANSFDVFDIVYDPAITASMEYIRLTEAGKIIPRINYNHRFETHGIQYELDFYPKLSKRFYGYLNYGYSDASIFPDHRAGAELFGQLPGGLETSAGVRHLSFDSASATILTASLGLYKGNYYFSLRPYYTLAQADSPALSGTLLMRKYLSNADNYLGLLLGMGYSTELKQLSSSNVLLAETMLFIESQQLRMEYQFGPREGTAIYKAHLGLLRQELIFEPGRYFWAVSAGLRYGIRF